MEDFLSQLGETSDALYQSIPVCETAGWRQVIDEGGLKAFISKTGSTRSEYTVEAGIVQVREAVKDYTTVKNWDPSFEKHEFVMPVNTDTYVARRCFNFSGRYPVDFVYFMKEVKEESGVVLMGQSVVPPFFPPTIPPYTRGELTQYHFILRKVDDSHTKIIVVYGVELPIELPEDVSTALQDEDLRAAKRIGDFARVWTPYLGAEVLKAEALAIENIPESWEILSNENGVKGARSIGLESVVSQGVLHAGVNQVLTLLQDPMSVNTYLPYCASCKLISAHEPKIQVMQRLYIAGEDDKFEYIYYTRVFPLEDGSYIIVGKSLDHPDYPVGKSFRGEFLNHSYILRKVSETETKVTVLFRINPKMIAPLEFVRDVQEFDGRTVERMSVNRGNYMMVMDMMEMSKAEVMKVVGEYSSYEKLAGEGPVQGFRSADCKTVISIGELEHPLEAVKAAITNPANLPKWLPGHKEESVVAFMNYHTTLYHRVLAVPSLPDVEAYFVQKEYEESKDLVLLVCRSVDLPILPRVKQGNVEVKYMNFSFYLQRVSPTTTNVALIINVVHPFEIDPTTLRAIQTGDALKVHVISSLL